MKTTKKQENGRTMGEMLSTLSIMGLLSLGGLLAFNSVIENFRIGSLCDEISARAIYASSKFKSQNKNQVVFRKFKHDYALGQFEKSTTLVKNAFTIVINQIKDDICQKVKKRFEEQNTTALFVCNLEQQKALITFYKNLKPTSGNPIVPCNSDDMCDDCEVCSEHGFCQMGCQNDESCVYKKNGRQLLKNQKTCCLNENVMNGICCPSVTYDETTDEKLCCFKDNKTECCPEGEFYSSNTSIQGCTSCDYDGRILVNGDNCATCEQRVTSGISCFLNCPEPEQVVQNGYCYCPNTRPVQHWNSGKCLVCDSPKGTIGMTRPTILELENTISDCAVGFWCGNYSCGRYIVACGPNEIGTNSQNPNHNFKLIDGSIPEEKDSYGTCYPCSQIDITTIKFEAQCTRCGGTWSGENWYTGTCQ